MNQKKISKIYIIWLLLIIICIFINSKPIVIQATQTRHKTLLIGETFQLKAKENVKWKSKNSKIATVSQNGIVKGIKKGNTKIIAKSDKGKKVYFFTIKQLAKELSPEKIYKIASKSTVQIETYGKNGSEIAIGSGFFIKKGVLVTNYHVIEDAMYIDVFTYDGTFYNVEGVYACDKEKDLAILQVNSDNQSLSIGKKDVLTGDTVYTLGSSEGLTGTFSNGIVSNAARKEGMFYYIQITAPLSSGNSGGPLLNSYGEVIGINTMQYVEGQNLNFAIPIQEVESIDYFHSPKTIAEVTQADKEEEQKVAYELPEQSKTMETSQLLEENEIMTGKMEIDSNLDYYHVNIKKESWLGVLIGTTIENDYFGLNLEILDKEGNSIDFYEKRQYEEGTVYIVSLLKGDYYIRISPKELLGTKETEYNLQVITERLE